MTGPIPDAADEQVQLLDAIIVARRMFGAVDGE